MTTSDTTSLGTNNKSAGPGISLERAITSNAASRTYFNRNNLRIPTYKVIKAFLGTSISINPRFQIRITE